MRDGIRRLLILHGVANSKSYSYQQEDRKRGPKGLSEVHWMEARFLRYRKIVTVSLQFIIVDGPGREVEPALPPW